MLSRPRVRRDADIAKVPFVTARRPANMPGNLIIKAATRGRAGPGDL